MIPFLRKFFLTFALALVTGFSTKTMIATQLDDRKRVSASDKSDQVNMTIGLSQDIKMKVKAANKKNVSACEARQNLSYYSGYEVVEVRSEIKMIGCQVARGTYAIRVTHKLEEGEKNHTTFVEPWELKDTDTLITSKIYDLGPDQHISKVRPREISCECVEVAKIK